MRKPVAAYFLGTRPYREVHALQERLLAACIEGKVDDVILLVEHTPVVTLGRGAKGENILFSTEALERMRVDRVETGRGGDVTYHGPGQLVGYPILDLKPDRCDLRRYVRCLEEVMILVARDHGVECGPAPGKIGVWADADRPTEWAGEPWASRLVKVGAIGVRVSRWVTMHGFAINLETDLSGFALIVPCGIKDFGVGSIQSLTGRAPSVHATAMSLAPHLSRGLELDVLPVNDATGVSERELGDWIFARVRRARDPGEQAQPSGAMR